MIFDEICVLGNGDVVCSCADPSGIKVYGNVKRQRIEDIYNGADYRTRRQAQLTSPGSSWCDVIGSKCSGRVSQPLSRDTATGRVVKMLQLEPASYCNLRCPGCPSTVMAQDVDPNYRSDRMDMLSLETMLDVTDQLPALEKLLFYNFGEPFLHPQALPFLRQFRSRRPDVVVHTSTNGLVLTAEKIDAIARERLLDRIIFSIDGARQESYERYRVRGRLDRALGNMAALVRACEHYGTRDKIEIHWQYILFEWNDSDKEIDRARELARRAGVPLHWVVTHTGGASQRYRAGSEALKTLLQRQDTYGALTCEMRASDHWENDGIAEGRYSANLLVQEPRVTTARGAAIELPLEITNSAPHDWPSWNQLNIGVQLQTPGGRLLSDLHRQLLPLAIRKSGARTSLSLHFNAPENPGKYHLFIDVVHEGVCWFSERGSRPSLVELNVC